MALWETHFIHSIASLWMTVCVCFHVSVYIGIFCCYFSSQCPDQERFSKPPLRPFKKRLWIPLALEKLLIHPNRHTCPFPVSVYYTAMILLRRLPLQWNTICFELSPISFSHHSRQAFAKPKALRKPHFCHSFYSPPPSPACLRIFQIAEVLN